MHPEMFKGSRRKFSHPKADQVAANRQNSFKSDERLRKIQKRLVNKQRATSKRLLNLGVQYSLDVQVCYILILASLVFSCLLFYV